MDDSFKTSLNDLLNDSLNNSLKGPINESLNYSMNEYRKNFMNDFIIDLMNDPLKKTSIDFRYFISYLDLEQREQLPPCEVSSTCPWPYFMIHLGSPGG